MSNEKVFSRTLTKKQVARLLAVSPGTLRSWLNIKYYDQIYQFGYRKTNRILTPKVLNYLAEKIDLQPD